MSVRRLMGRMNRRRFLALAGPFGGTVVGGCLEDGPETSNVEPGGEASDDSARELKPLGDGDGVYGQVGYTGVAAWLRSSAALESISFLFDDAYHDALSTYVEETDFDSDGIAVYTTSLPDSSYELFFDGATVSEDRIAADFSADYDEDHGAAAAVFRIGALVRIPAVDPPPELVVERNDETISNRYEIHLEKISDDELGELLSEDELTDQPVIADLSAVPSDARSPIESAIEDGKRELEEVPDPLARTVADHAYVRDGDAYYELAGEFPEYVLASEIHDRDAVDAEPGDETVLDLRDLRDESEAAYDMIVAAMRDEARRVALPPALKTVLDEYDYVWRQPTFVELSVTVDDPGPPYELRATPVSRADVLAELDETGTLIAVDDLSDAARREVRAALEDEDSHDVFNPPALFEIDPVRRPEAELDHRQSYVVVEDAVYRPVIEDRYREHR